MKAGLLYTLTRAVIIAGVACTAFLLFHHTPSATSLTTTFTRTNLVSDVAGLAARTDPNLVNPWE